MTGPPPGKRDVRAEQTGIAAGGDVHQQVGRDAIGRDRISIDNLVVAPPPVDRAAALDNEQHARLAGLVRRWYDERLAQALDRVVRLELDLDADAGAVSQPLDRFVPRDRGVQPLPAGTSILEVFTGLGGEQGGLLILGDPGAGKTTLLFDLALALALTGEGDRSRPVPTYVALSTWQQRRRPIAEWLAEQLTEMYFVPRKTARPWVERGRVLPLLDGLDEIDDPDARAGCVSAINEFRREYGLPVVVCSRSTDYRMLQVQLALEAAVALRPLDPDVVLRYVTQAGPALAGVRVALEDDPDLLVSCRSPLLLSMLTLAYYDQPATQVQAGGSPGQRRERLFCDYVNRRLNFLAERSGEPIETRDADAGRQRTLHWLGALAGSLTRHNQRVLLLERMRPDWLPVRRVGTVLATAVAVATTIFGCVLFTILFALGFPHVEPGHGLRANLGEGLVYGLAFGLIGAVDVRLGAWGPAERVTWSWKTGRRSWRSSVRAAARDGTRMAMAGTAVWSVVIVVDFLLSNSFNFASLLEGIVVNASRGGLTGALVGGLVAILFETDVIAQTVRPNEGIRRSLSNSALLFLIGAPLGGVVFCAGSIHPFWGLVGGVYSGLFLALFHGLGAVIQHTALRVLLWRHGLAPLRYVRWLEDMVRARLLYRVGGGYEFVHVLLRDYLETYAPRS